MRIHNVRLGFANNSSSTHSLILLDVAGSLKTDEDRRFGWDYFTAADARSKDHYLALVMRDSLSGLGPEERAQVVAELFPDLPRGELDDVLADGYVDHQSRWSMPRDWGGGWPDREFAADFRRYLADPRIAILGGNDNGGDVRAHPNAGAGRLFDVGLPTWGAPVARKDSGAWTLFNRDTGAKVRFDFGGGPPPVRASAPELVDVKITGHCTFGCAYCYQASTPAGVHAPFARLEAVADWLAAARVFEVALGGGEPTLHPDFPRVLEAFRDRGVVPNFTTRNLAWLRNESLADRIQGACGSYAVSVDGPDDVRRVAAAVGLRKRQGPSVQVVVGSGADVAGVLQAAWDARLPVTLLGFKRVGFGAAFPAVEEDWVATYERAEAASLAAQRLAGAAHAFFRPRLSIDTALAAGSEAALERLGVPAVLYGVEEGKFSMYLDAVAMRAGPSSYCAEADYRPVATQDDLLAAFRSW
jgi:hypothetical protein